MNSPLLQAALSHFVAIRDKSLAELDVYLNRSAGVGEHASVTDEVIKLFATLESADSTISTIKVIIDGNTPSISKGTYKDMMQQSIERKEHIEEQNTEVETKPE